MTRALDTLDRAMEAYVSQASSGGTAQGGALTPALGSQGGDLALQIQKSMEEGLAAAAAPPAVRGGSGVWGAIGVPQTSAGEAGAKLVDDATADKLLLERTMVDFLTRKGGLKLTKDMSPEQRRTAIRQAVERIVGKSNGATLNGFYGKEMQTPPDSNNVEIQKEIRQQGTGGLEGIDIGQAREKVKDLSIEKCIEAIKDAINLDSESAFIEARDGGKHKGVYSDAVRKRQGMLEKSIRSRIIQVEEHADKIRHPERYDIGWAEKTERQRAGLLKKWEKDLRRNAEQAGIEIEVWKERFGNDK